MQPAEIRTGDHADILSCGLRIRCLQQGQDALQARHSEQPGPGKTTGTRGRARRAAGTRRSVIARPLGIHAAAGRGDPPSERTAEA
jgi:hypothetical protein